MIYFFWAEKNVLAKKLQKVKSCHRDFSPNKINGNIFFGRYQYFWIWQNKTCLIQVSSSRGGLAVEQWSNNRLLSATVDQIPLGAMIYIFKVSDMNTLVDSLLNTRQRHENRLYMM